MKKENRIYNALLCILVHYILATNNFPWNSTAAVLITAARLQLQALIIVISLQNFWKKLSDPKNGHVFIKATPITICLLKMAFEKHVFILRFRVLYPGLL